MFKFIGGLVVYGLALYGLVEGLDQLTKSIAKRPASESTREDLVAEIRETLNRNRADGSTVPS